jgi:hypothetical protein
MPFNCLKNTRHFIIKTTIFSALIPLVLTGCVGAGPVVTKTAISTPYGNMCPSKEIGIFFPCKEGEVAAKKSEDFLEVWGEPKSREVKDGREQLTYNNGVAWRGLVIFAIVPIPLMLPVGQNGITLTFENDSLVQISREYGQGNFAICGLHSEGPDPIGCLVWH